MNRRFLLTIAVVTLVGVMIAGAALANNNSYEFNISIPGWQKESTYNETKDCAVCDAEVWVGGASYGIKGRLQTADGSKSGAWNDPLTIGVTEYLSPPSGLSWSYSAHVQFYNKNIHTNEIWGTWIPR